MELYFFGSIWESQGKISKTQYVDGADSDTT